MSILAAIKSERKMSLKHWRYRLLHWTFFETATTVSESKLPTFLYTHYCPLFHLTNIIVLMMPLILTFRLLASIITGVCGAIGYVIQQIVIGFQSIKFEKPEPPPITTEEGRAIELHDFLTLLRENPKYRYGFEHFWSYEKHHFKYCTEEDLKARYDRVVEAIREKEEKDALAAERRKKMILKLISISQVVVQGIVLLGMCVAFLGLCGLIYLLVGALPSIGNAIATFFTVHLPDFFGAIWAFLCNDVPWDIVGMVGLVSVGAISAIALLV